MLFPRETVDAIAAGRVTVAFRKWRRPTVRAGGTLQTPAGLLGIEAVERIEESDITDSDAHDAGYQSRDELLRWLRRRDEGELYRIRFRVAGPDPRIALRNDTSLDADTYAGLVARLDRLDRSSTHGPWTLDTLRLIRERPAVRAADLATHFGRETLPFKADVRKLKALGLTESLEVGYRLSPRGEALLARLEGDG